MQLLRCTRMRSTHRSAVSGDIMLPLRCYPESVSTVVAYISFVSADSSAGEGY